MDGEFVRFGYTGQRTADIADGIRISDAEWLLDKLDRLTEAQIGEAVRASGGTEDEAVVFSRALRDRLDRLREAARRPAAALVGNAKGSEHLTRHDTPCESRAGSGGPALQ